MSESMKCSKRVFSGQRWDFGGHPCQRKAIVERDGKWWCRMHDPLEVKRRDEARQAARAAEWAEKDRRLDDALATARKAALYDTEHGKVLRYEAALKSIVQRFDQAGEGARCARDGLAGAMADDARKALEVRE